MSDERRQRRWRDLMVARALFGLTPDEQRELDALRAEGHADDESWELAAAALCMVGRPRADEPMPAALEERIRVQGRRAVASRG